MHSTALKGIGRPGNSLINRPLYSTLADWSAGELEHELAFDSWHIVAATEEDVLAEDTGDIWRTLLISQQYRAAADRAGSALYLWLEAPE